MKALQIILTQNNANYKREEIFNTKMTYPLPPFSTVIGALHRACGYKEYHPMQISIQGKFGSLYRKTYTDHCYLNSLYHDRANLVFVKNPNIISCDKTHAAKALAQTGNDFRKGVTIKVENEEALDYYRKLRDMSDENNMWKKKFVDPLAAEIKKLNKAIKENSDKEEKTNLKEEKKKLEEQLKLRKEEYSKKDTSCESQKSHFKSLVTSVKQYEILSDVQLVLHICSDEKTMNDIYDNVYNIRCLGRSEDWVWVEDARFVELNNKFDVDDEKLEYRNDLQMYIDHNLIHSGVIKSSFCEGVSRSGTRYFLNKDYEIIDGKRIFNKKHVVYMSKYEVNGNAENLYLSPDGYLVNLV